MGDSIVFQQNPLNMQVTEYAKVTFCGPSGDVPITPIIGLVADPMSGLTDKVICETRDQLQRSYYYDGEMIIFGQGRSVSVYGPYSGEQIIITDGTSKATFVSKEYKYGSFVLYHNKVTSTLTRYAEVTLSGPMGSVPLRPGGTFPHSIFGPFKQLEGKTKDGFREWFIRRGATVNFGKNLPVTCTGPDEHNQITMTDGVNSAIVEYVTQVAGSLVFATNTLDMKQTEYVKIMFSGPAGDVPVVPAFGLVTDPISADIDTVYAWTKDDFRQTFMFQYGVVKFDSGATVSVTGPNVNNQITISDGTSSGVLVLLTNPLGRLSRMD